MSDGPLILLTGATGFVGKQVLKNLLISEARVRLIVRQGRASAVPDSDLVESIWEVEDLFCATAEWLDNACRGVDIVVHCAWYAEPGKYLTSPKNLDCLSGTLRLASASVRAKVGYFLGIGTCFEYEPKDESLTVNSKLNPETLYAATKASAYFSLTEYFRQTKTGFSWARLFYLYGEGEDERRLVPYLKARLALGEPAELSTGTQVRDYMDVSDAGQMIAKIALERLNGPINICSGEALTVKTLAERIADSFGRRDLLRFGARPANLVDPPFVVGVPGPMEPPPAQPTELPVP